MLKKLKRLWRRKPLLIIMPLAILTRLLFILINFFSGEKYSANGYWEGIFREGNPRISVFYRSLLDILNRFFDLTGIDNFSYLELFEKIVHASWSLVIVYFGYKITERIASRRSARLAGLLLAVFYFFPALAFVPDSANAAFPFLVLAIWFIISREDAPVLFGIYFISGLFLGLAFITDTGAIIFIIGILVSVLLRGRIKGVLGLITGALIPVILLEGSVNYFFYDYPFFNQIYQIKTEFDDFRLSGTIFGKELILLFISLIPPVSLFLFFGYFRSWKKYLVIFLPAFIFLLYNFLFFYNFQFIACILTTSFIIIGGVAGWNDFLDLSPFWQDRMKWLKYSWAFFWFIDVTLLLIFLSIEIIYRPGPVFIHP